MTQVFPKEKSLKLLVNNNNNNNTLGDTEAEQYALLPMSQLTCGIFQAGYF